MYFHKRNCKRGLECLRDYHAKFNQAMNFYSDAPEHNWASHGADAYLYMAQEVKQAKEKGPTALIPNAVNTGRIF